MSLTPVTGAANSAISCKGLFWSPTVVLVWNLEPTGSLMKAQICPTELSRCLTFHVLLERPETCPWPPA